ncbi:MAG: hypothetical protein KDD60_11990, partial [Bdellovibrionales bacterium]|nr:hypothetical protein [Bdellovibrionales bacterium]
GGITAGQGTGFEFMVDPYLRYEANYIKIVNNIIHDINGAALGVNGGYGILLANNTAYRTGERSHLLEIVYGERSCDGDTNICTQYQNAGGWGPKQIGSDFNQPIGNTDVIVANNVFYNPSGFTTGSQHFAIYGPRNASATGIPSPQKTDDGLLITGNIVWNGNNEMPVGVEDSEQGCQSGNPTCTLAQILADNSINTLEPDFINAAEEDFRPVASGQLAGVSGETIPTLPVIDADLNPITEGVRENTLTREFSGAAATTRPPGAIASSTSSIEFPSADSGNTPEPGEGGGSSGNPSLTVIKASAKRAGKNVKIAVKSTASDDDGISTVRATVLAGEKELASFDLSLKGQFYVGKTKVKSKRKNLSIRVVATDETDTSTTVTRKAKVR